MTAFVDKTLQNNIKKIKVIIVLTLLFLISGFKNESNNVEGLPIKFIRVSEEYLRPGYPNGSLGSMPIEASEGMKFVKLKVTLKNEGQQDCIFDFSDVYISRQQDTLYRFLKLQAYYTSTKTKIKPHKEIKRIILFEFPENNKPKELFIEDKRYLIIEEK